MRRELIAELFGTFCLVFAGTGAIIANDVTSGGVGHVGVAMTFGLIVMCMIYALGGVSGAHFNPAVTLTLLFERELNVRKAIGYVGAQTAGALLASSVLLLLFPDHLTLGATFPHGSELQSFVLEIVLTMMLMFVILSVGNGEQVRNQLAGIAIGGVVGLEALFAGPICGASMNPARSFAPAIVSGQTDHLWIYLSAPFIGALLAALLARWIFPPHSAIEVTPL